MAIVDFFGAERVVTDEAEIEAAVPWPVVLPSYLPQGCESIGLLRVEVPEDGLPPDALMMDGLSNKEIGERLCRQQSTLKRHRQNLYNETGTHSEAGLIAWGHRWLRKEFLGRERPLHSPDDGESRNLHRSV